MGSATDILKKHGVKINHGHCKIKEAVSARAAVAKVNKGLAKVGLRIATGQVESPSKSEIKMTADLNQEKPSIGSRAAMILEAKARSIKLFRIMNKAELEEVLREGTTPARIKDIQNMANVSWHAGWSKNKEVITDGKDAKQSDSAQ